MHISQLHPTFLLLLATIITTHALPTPSETSVNLIYQFPNTTWIENLAVRRNGDILCTSLSAAAIFLVNPFEHTEERVLQFVAGNGVLGITEIGDDIFVAVTSQVNLMTSEAAAGSAAAWRIDMKAWSSGRENFVTLLANLTQIGLPDGIVSLPSRPTTILIADAAKGLVWKLDTLSGNYTIVIEDDILHSSNPFLPLGVDGLHVIDEYLYFTNLGDNILCRIAIDKHGNATDEIELVATMPFPDDFALAQDGTAYVVGANQLYRVSPDGVVVVLAGGINDTTLEGVTSAQFGRTREDAGVLYMGTNGGLLAPVNGRLIGGQILAIDIEQFI
ncbi:hypothetical protein LTR78_008418 [Recurvomyces mirabilis]|uniref:SMP-30/Gluconolactonase/LRE-like region domain-containing protein n=1 Tax=Recurvomyces mirabilis TaxID=574656 RepID=A0AAE0WIZ1_9PEZI|nr:hypothetical protein LTR78_008418 [Recurvomyces mirabilis]KAK5155406.1 hypothetical protein LTS14_005667 [Recurvomyces mirabilis]